MERGRMLESALDNHAVAVAYTRVAGHAINVVSFLAAKQEVTVQLDLRRQLVTERSAMFSRQVITVWIELLAVEIGVFEARNGSVNRETRGTMIREKLATTQRNELGLVVHVLAAAGKQPRGGHDQQNHSCLCRALNTAPPKPVRDDGFQEIFSFHSD